MILHMPPLDTVRYKLLCQSRRICVLSSVTGLANVDPAMDCTKNTVTYSSHRSVVLQILTSLLLEVNHYTFLEQEKIRSCGHKLFLFFSRLMILSGRRVCVTHVVLQRRAFRRNSKKWLPHHTTAVGFSSAFFFLARWQTCRKLPLASSCLSIRLSA